jgi:aspartate 1-decarboxylase
VNGAAAHKADVGDILIIASYAMLDENEISGHKPNLCYVNEKNELTHSK